MMQQSPALTVTLDEARVCSTGATWRQFLLPLATLALYVTIAWVWRHVPVIKDEGRYIIYAERLTQGHYTTPADPLLINGPGYPLYLAPLVAAGVPLTGLRMANALLVALAVWFTYRGLRLLTNKSWAVAGGLLVMLHPTMLREGGHVMSEAMAVACLSGFLWAFAAFMRSVRWHTKAFVLASLALGMLCMTRVLFGHVIMALMLGCLCIGLFAKALRPALKRTFFVLLGAFILCVPWLAFTKKVTGKNLAWSTNAGELLYWMTSTHPGENGHWFSVPDACSLPELAPNHAAFHEKLAQTPPLEQEALYKAKAIEQLRANPKGVAMNWASNVSRLFFGFPRSYQSEKLSSLALVLVNGPLLLALAVAVGICLKRWREISMEAWFCLAAAALYLGASTIAPALPRYFLAISPAVFFAVAIIFQQFVRVSLRPRE